MKKHILFSFLGLLFAFAATAQMDLGLQLGGSNYLGEIGGEGEPKPFLLDLDFKQTNMTVGAFFRYDFTERISGKLQMNYVRLKGADKFSTEPARVARNLSFRTEVYEAMLTGEYNFLMVRNISPYSKSRVDFESYAFTGFGALIYHPYAQLDGKWHALRPLTTEGADNKYKEMTIAIPLGVGAHFSFDNQFRLGLEIGYRFTFTDYLDDVSGRYASPSDLPNATAIALADRSAAAFASDKYDNLPDPAFYGGRGAGENNPRRGNPVTKDGYLLFQVNASMMISSGRGYKRSRYKSQIRRRMSRRKF